MTFEGAGNLVIIAGVILGGLGYAVGQFMSGRSKAQAEENAALKERGDRQEKEIAELRAELAELRAEMVKMHTENETLRSLLTSGGFLAEQIRVMMHEEIQAGAQLAARLVNGDG